MMSDLSRFLKPQSIAVFGGSWAKNVIDQLSKSGYGGSIWPVHPTRSEIGGIKCYANIEALPGVPDAAFIGVNRQLTIDVIEQLKIIGAGGAICFASGFREASEEHQIQHAETLDLQDQLVAAAGDMPVLGPNCYGYLNYLDNVTLWPDQHGGQPVHSGVAIIAQSSNVAINMTMQRRGLSVAALCTVGNQACVGLNELAEHFLADPRVTALGLFIEGFADIPAFEAMAAKASQAGKSIVALKLGKSAKSQQATLSHTATLAGGSAASSALLQRLGIVEIDSVSEFIETLKILDVIGPLSGPKISSVSCSGGEASLMADAVMSSNLEFPDLSDAQRIKIGAVLGAKVTLDNPLDYHTYVWGDVPGMTDCFAGVMEGGFDLNIFVLDMPRSDICETSGHQCAIDAIIAAKQRTNARVAVITSLPENMNEAITAEFHQQGVVVLHGLESGLKPVQSAVKLGVMATMETAVPIWISPAADNDNAETLSESVAKDALAEFGMPIPHTRTVKTKDNISEAASSIPFPLVLKGLGLAHKSEVGAVILDIRSKAALEDAIDGLPDSADGYLIEQMIDAPLAEVIVGVTRDVTGMLLLTLGAGGVLTELLSDSASMLMPATREDVDRGLKSLKLNTILQGYRGKPAADVSALIDAVMAVQRYVEANKDKIEELDINPIIVREHDVVAVDALVRLRC
jgi:acyl-CoA synthetase (NDP forming)